MSLPFYISMRKKWSTSFRNGRIVYYYNPFSCTFIGMSLLGRRTPLGKDLLDREKFFFKEIFYNFDTLSLLTEEDL